MAAKKGKTPWTVLRQRDTTGFPPLLIRPTVNDSGYNIAITDSCRVWRDVLESDDLERRANEISCPIDPSDDANRRYLLETIQKALKKEDGSSCQLLSEFSGETMTLLVTAPLPRPLPKLEWPIRLTRLPATAIATEFISPLLDRCIAWQSQIESLVNELKNKDHVIERLCDRLETSGDFLTTVFPGKSNIRLSKHKPQREQLAPHVPGLAPYESSATLKASKTPSTEAEQPSKFIDDEALNVHCLEGRIEHKDEWWQTLRQGVVSHMTDDECHEDEHPETHLCSEPKQQDAQNEDGEDQFEQTDRQNISADARNDAAYTAPHDIATEDETEDDTDNAATTEGRKAPTPTPSAQPTKSMPVRKIGTLGGLQAQSSRHDAADDNSARKSRPRLGTLGGKPAKPSPAPTEVVEDVPEVTTPQKPKPKLGALGGKKKADADNTKVTESAPKASAQVARAERAQTPQVNQTPVRTSEGDDRDVRASSQERADLKRDQLKRQLEDKVKVTGKKKRKF